MNNEASYIIRKQKKKIFNLNKVIVWLRIENSNLKALLIEKNENDKEKRKQKKDMKTE